MADWAQQKGEGVRGRVVWNWMSVGGWVDRSQGLGAVRRRGGKNKEQRRWHWVTWRWDSSKLNPQQWTKQNWCLGGCWVTQPSFLGFCVAFFFFWYRSMSRPTIPWLLKLMLTQLEGWALHQVSPLKGGLSHMPVCPRWLPWAGDPHFEKARLYHNTSLDMANFFLNAF